MEDMQSHDKVLELISAVEDHRKNLISHINRTTDAIILKIKCDNTSPSVKVPTMAQAKDERNKDGVNLTPRGVEILYRLFDDGAGYNRASKALGITQTAARNRKELWQDLGGLQRQKMHLDIDGE